MNNAFRQRVKAAIAAGSEIYIWTRGRKYPFDAELNLTIFDTVDFRYDIAVQVGTLPLNVIRCTGRTWRETRDEIRRELAGSKRRVA